MARTLDQGPLRDLLQGGVGDLPDWPVL